MVINKGLDKKVLAEVYEIISHLPPSEYKKIPKEIIQGIEDNMDLEYSKSYEEIRENMLDGTELTLATLYTYYLANPEEKALVTNMIEVEKKQKYNSNIIFRSNRNFEEISYSQALPIVQKNKNLLRRLLDKIKNFFNKG